jgi:hypothetical protein
MLAGIHPCAGNKDNENLSPVMQPKKTETAVLGGKSSSDPA